MKLDFYFQSDILELLESGTLTELLNEDGSDTDIRESYASVSTDKYSLPAASDATEKPRKELCNELAGLAAEELCQSWRNARRTA